MLPNLANVFYKLNPLRTREMVNLMDKEKAGKLNGCLILEAIPQEEQCEPVL
jgi:hypothetical protein